MIIIIGMLVTLVMIGAFWFSNIGSVIGSFGLLLSGLFFISHLNRKHNSEEEYPAWTNGTVIILALVVVFHLGLYYLWPTWWWEWFSKKGWIILQLVIAAGVRAAYEKKGVTLAYIVITIGILGLLFNAYRSLTLSTPGTAGNGLQPQIGRVVVSGRTINTAFLTVNPEGRAEVAAILDTKNIPAGQKEFLLGITGCESGHRHFEKGTTTLLRNKEKPNVVGYAQINKDAWPEELKSLGSAYDPDTPDGNLNMAIWILNNHGGYKWDCFNTVRDAGLKEVRVIAAPVDAPSVYVNNEARGLKWRTPDKIWVEVIDTNGKKEILPDGPGEKIKLPVNVKSLRFTSRTDKPVEVNVEYNT
jgi:hypothetical protein